MSSPSEYAHLEEEWAYEEQTPPVKDRAYRQQAQVQPVGEATQSEQAEGEYV